MDGLLSQSGGPQVRLSSTGIPDQTYKVKVGADDMLITAISQMNRRSGRYVFIDQARMKDGRWLEIQVNDADLVDDLPKPHYYIRGSISQLDGTVRDLGLTATYAPTELPADRGVTSARTGPGHTSSVVSVDLHLVRFPSREIVPGGSVSNAMVVTDNSWSAGMTGLIAKQTFGVTLKFQRLESTGQAVRNLVELGVIELLGRHSGVPYWSCLSLPSTEARPAARAERDFIRGSASSQITEVQELLISLGRLPAPATGQRDAATRAALSQYQAERGLIATGRADFDTQQALHREVAFRPPVSQPRALPQTASARSGSGPARSGDGSYQSLGVFLEPSED